MFVRALALISGATLLTSCASIVKVKDNADNKVSGIPFYVKNEYFRQETVYRETWYRLTLTVQKKLVDKKDGKEALKGTESFQAEVLDNRNDSIIEIKKAILEGDTSDVRIALALIDKFNNIKQRNGETIQKCVSNGIVSEWWVDDERTYYLNGALPWFGSGTLTQKLNDNGTLSETTSIADSKLAEAVASWIPLKEYLTGEFVEPAVEAVKDDNTKGTVSMLTHGIVQQGGTSQLATKEFAYVLSLTIEEVGYETTLTGDPVDRRPTLTPPPLALTAQTVAFSQKPLEEKGKEEKKEDAPTIGISGTIKLPKPDGPKDAS